LRLVEAMDLVDEEDRAASVQRLPVARFRDQLAELFDSGEDGGEGDELRARQQVRERRLPGARRPPQDQGVEDAALHHLPEDAPRSEQMLLPHELVDAPRPHALGEWRRAAALAR